MAASADQTASHGNLAAAGESAAAGPAPSSTAVPASDAARPTAQGSIRSSQGDGSAATLDRPARAAVAARLCVLQRADGRFPGGAALAAALGLPEASLRAILAEAAGALGGVEEGLLPTLVAVAAMRGPLAGERGVWELMEAKAVALLQGPAPAGDGGGVREAAAVLGRLLAERMPRRRAEAGRCGSAREGWNGGPGPGRVCVRV